MANNTPTFSQMVSSPEFKGMNENVKAQIEKALGENKPTEQRSGGSKKSKKQSSKKPTLADVTSSPEYKGMNEAVKAQIEKAVKENKTAKPLPNLKQKEKVEESDFVLVADAKDEVKKVPSNEFQVKEPEDDTKPENETTSKRNISRDLGIAAFNVLFPALGQRLEGLKKRLRSDKPLTLKEVGNSAFNTMFPTLGKMLEKTKNRLDPDTDQREEKKRESGGINEYSRSVDSLSEQVSRSSVLIKDFTDTQLKTNQLLEQIFRVITRIRVRNAPQPISAQQQTPPSGAAPAPRPAPAAAAAPPPAASVPRIPAAAAAAPPPAAMAGKAAVAGAAVVAGVAPAMMDRQAQPAQPVIRNERGKFHHASTTFGTFSVDFSSENGKYTLNGIEVNQQTYARFRELSRIQPPGTERNDPRFRGLVEEIKRTDPDDAFPETTAENVIKNERTQEIINIINGRQTPTPTPRQTTAAGQQQTPTPTPQQTTAAGQQQTPTPATRETPSDQRQNNNQMSLDQAIQRVTREPFVPLTGEERRQVLAAPNRGIAAEDSVRISMRIQEVLRNNEIKYLSEKLNIPVDRIGSSVISPQGELAGAILKDNSRVMLQQSGGGIGGWLNRHLNPFSSARAGELPEGPPTPAPAAAPAAAAPAAVLPIGAAATPAEPTASRVQTEQDGNVFANRILHIKAKEIIFKAEQFKYEQPGGGTPSGLPDGAPPAPGGATGAPPAPGGATPPPAASFGPQSMPGVGGATPAGAPQLTSIRTKSGKNVQVAASVADRFQGFLNDLEGTGYQIREIGGYANRPNVNNPSVMSVHASGMAIDINPAQNPNRSTTTDMPQQTAQIAARWGLGWGMNWRSVQDPMHFSAARNEGGSTPNPNIQPPQQQATPAAGAAAQDGAPPGGGGSAPAAPPSAPPRGASLEPSSPSSGAQVQMASVQSEIAAMPSSQIPPVEEGSAPASASGSGQGMPGIDPNNPGSVEPADAGRRFANLFGMSQAA